VETRILKREQESFSSSIPKGERNKPLKKKNNEIPRKKKDPD